MVLAQPGPRARGRARRTGRAGCELRRAARASLWPTRLPVRTWHGPSAPIRLRPMCGIVGYVGPNVDGRALDVVMEGLAPAGVPRVRLGRCGAGRRRRVATEKRAGKLANLDRPRIEAEPLPRATTGIGHTRWATHGGPTDANAHPHRGGDDGKLALIHNGIIENFHALQVRACRPTGVAFPSETDTEVVAHLLARAYDATGDLTEAMRAVVQAASRRLHPAGRPRRPARRGRRRPPQQPAGRRPRRGRELPRVRRRRLHRPHPRRARARPGPDRHDHPERRHGHRLRRHARPRASTTTSTGTPPPPRRAATTTSWRRRSTSSRTRSPTPCSAAPTRAAAWSWTRCGSPRRTCARSTRSSSSPAAPRAYAGHGRQVRDRALDPHPVRGRAGPRVPLPRPGRRRAHAGRRDLASPARPWTPSWRSSTPASWAPRPSPSATPTARRSRASPTPSSTPTPAPRSRSRRPRRSWPRSPPATSSGSTSPSCAAARSPTRRRP